MPDLERFFEPGKMPTKLAERYAERGINWIRVGENILDKRSDWLNLVHNCTFPDSELTKAPLAVGA